MVRENYLNDTTGEDVHGIYEPGDSNVRRLAYHTCLSVKASDYYASQNHLQMDLWNQVGASSQEQWLYLNARVKTLNSKLYKRARKSGVHVIHNEMVTMDDIAVLKLTLDRGACQL